MRSQRFPLPALGLAALFGALCTLVGCSVVADSVSNVDESTDCDQVCDRYADCYDSSYDAEVCQNRCFDNAETVQGFADKLDVCEECMDDKSCSEATFNCATACNGIVP